MVECYIMIKCINYYHNMQTVYTNVLFPRIVMSAIVGFVLYLCHDLSFLIAGARFWFFCSNLVVNFAVFRREIF